MDGDRQMHVPKRQSHLPRATPMRFINHEDEYNVERALVPVMSYADDQMPSTSNVTSDLWRMPPLVNHHGDQFSMDLKTLMFIAGQAKVGMPQAPKRLPNVFVGPCYHCGGDHLIKDCPYLHQPRSTHGVPNLMRHCVECAIKHVVPECPMNPKNKRKATLNTIETIPSPSGTESDGAQSANTSNRAQKQTQEENKEEAKTERSSRNSWKARRQRRKAAQKRRAEKAKSDEEVVKKDKEEKHKEG